MTECRPYVVIRFSAGTLISVISVFGTGNDLAVYCRGRLKDVVAVCVDCTAYELDIVFSTRFVEDVFISVFKKLRGNFIVKGAAGYVVAEFIDNVVKYAVFLKREITTVYVDVKLF